MLAAMEMVLDDGADVLNMSIGSALEWPQYPTAKAADRLVKHGVVVVAVDRQRRRVRTLLGRPRPALARNVIGVASFDNTDANLVAFTISPDDTKIGYIAAAGAPPPPKPARFRWREPAPPPLYRRCVRGACQPAA